MKTVFCNFTELRKVERPFCFYFTLSVFKKFQEIQTMDEVSMEINGLS